MLFIFIFSVRKEQTFF